MNPRVRRRTGCETAVGAGDDIFTAHDPSYRVAAVAPVSVADLEDVYLLRAELEALATREAVARGTETWLNATASLPGLSPGSSPDALSVGGPFTLLSANLGETLMHQRN
jgi:hypothetical protein